MRDRKITEALLETKRLVLRRWNEDDAGNLYKYAADPAVVRSRDGRRIRA